MSDVVDRLRKPWSDYYTVENGKMTGLLEEAAAEIERLRGVNTVVTQCLAEVWVANGKLRSVVGAARDLLDFENGDADNELKREELILAVTEAVCALDGEPCPMCKGQGLRPHPDCTEIGPVLIMCQTCGGRGGEWDSDGKAFDSCPTCGGSGTVPCGIDGDPFKCQGAMGAGQLGGGMRPPIQAESIPGCHAESGCRIADAGSIRAGCSGAAGGDTDAAGMGCLTLR